jgi:hypothetical protein
MTASRTLLALTASALALPGLTPKAKADAAPTITTVGYRLSGYREDELERGKLLIGSAQRYDIDIHQFSLLAPIGENYSLGVNASYESMSGASPWYTLSRSDGTTGVVMSGATISEQRRDLSLNGRRYLNNGTLGITVAASHENDYDSISLGMDGERHFNNDLTTVASGFSLAADDITPTDAALFNRVTDASKQSRSVFVSVTQVIDQTSLVQTGLSVTHLSGYLTDPYKFRDQRPDSRTQWAWSTAYRRYFSEANAALHADYRYYHDTFGIDSHTFALEWYQNLGDSWQLIPGVRWYSQGAADFFTPASNFLANGPNSADYRLSAYGAVSGTLKLQWQLDKAKLSLAAERYRAATGYGLQDGAGSPALVSFKRLTLGIDYSF